MYQRLFKFKEKLSHIRFKKRNADNNIENCLIIQKLYAVGRNVLTPKRKKSYKIIIVFLSVR